MRDDSGWSRSRVFVGWVSRQFQKLPVTKGRSHSEDSATEPRLPHGTDEGHPALSDSVDLDLDLIVEADDPNPGDLRIGDASPVDRQVRQEPTFSPASDTNSLSTGGINPNAYQRSGHLCYRDRAGDVPVRFYAPPLEDSAGGQNFPMLTTLFDVHRAANTL